MTGDPDGGNGGREQGDAGGAPDRTGPRFSLRRVDGPIDGANAPAGQGFEVRLHREFKGLTVADLMRSEIAERLPGQVQRALRQIQNGAFAAADEALPGAFPPIFAGPGSARAGRRGPWLLVTALLVGAAAVAAAWWWW